jgi:hypothetical protein
MAVLAYTIDRPDLADAFVEARGQDITVYLGVDRRFSLSSRCREQDRLEAEGCIVRLLDGGPAGGFHRDVGRSQGGRRIAHSKTLIANVPEGPYGIVGSSNWTTSNRANLSKCPSRTLALRSRRALGHGVESNGQGRGARAGSPRAGGRLSMTPRRARSLGRGAMASTTQEEECIAQLGEPGWLRMVGCARKSSKCR